MVPLSPLYKPNNCRVSWILIENRPEDISAGFTMHTHHIIPTLALVRRGSSKQSPAKPRDLHRIDCESDPPAVILATLPTFPKNQTTRALCRLGREPAPPGR